MLCSPRASEEGQQHGEATNFQDKAKYIFWDMGKYNCRGRTRRYRRTEPGTPRENDGLPSNLIVLVEKICTHRIETSGSIICFHSTRGGKEESRGRLIKAANHLSRRAASEVVPGDHDGVLGRRGPLLHCNCFIFHREIKGKEIRPRFGSPWR